MRASPSRLYFRQTLVPSRKKEANDRGFVAVASLFHTFTFSCVGSQRLAPALSPVRAPGSPLLPPLRVSHPSVPFRCSRVCQHASSSLVIWLNVHSSCLDLHAYTDWRDTNHIAVQQPAGRKAIMRATSQGYDQSLQKAAQAATP